MLLRRGGPEAIAAGHSLACTSHAPPATSHRGAISALPLVTLTSTSRVPSSLSSSRKISRFSTAVPMNRQGPRLKNGVDLQLQSAFSDGNWQVAMRLAEKRAKLLNDQYYEVVKICAESQLDDPTAKLAAVSAVWQYARSGAVIKDVDALELLEWATQHLISEDDFAETFGQLKVRAAKASPKDRVAVTKCLESCLLHWDLNSAQQIAAILDRSFPAEKDFHFWNIVITHMLSSSPQSPPEKKKLYGTLAQKQIERAAQAAEQAEQAEASTDGAAAAVSAVSAAPKPPVRRVQTEEETILLYDIVDAHGTAEDFEKLISSAAFSPVSQFRQGRKELLQRAVDKYRRDGNWAAVFQLCKECLSEVDEDGQPTLLACDFVTWKYLISAASHQKDASPTVIENVRELLSQLLASKNMRSMYRRNILLSRVSAAFELGPSDEEDVIHGEPSSLRLRELLYYINDQSTSVACFNDIKGFLERLDAKGLRYLADEHLPRLSSQSSDKLSATRLNILSLKAQYFELTSRSKTPTIATAASFLTCLSQLSKSAVRYYKSMRDGEEGSALMTEIVPELSILIASCSLIEAFHVQTKQGTIPASARRQVLQAVVLLEDQLSKNPIHPQISLMLVLLHLFLGSAYRASEIWEAIGVKRTIVDSLAPIFYDRISTISPSLLSPSEEWGEYFRDLLRTHYDASLKLRMPRRLIDAFEAGSYGSVVEIPKYLQDLRASGTRVMSLTESKRAERFLGLATLDLMNDPRYYEVNDEVLLVEQIDYGSFPSWGSNASQPLHLSLRVGPGPSSRRCHLSLLSETFHDVLSYKPPPVYKASSSSGTDTVFIVEMMNRLSNSFAKFLPGLDSDFTSSEIVYFEALSVLSTLISVYVYACPDRPQSSLDGLDQLLEGLRAALETQQMLAPRYDKAVENIVDAMGSMHGLSMLRDTVVAIKMSTQWMITWNEREKERDRSGQSGLPKGLVVGLKSLHAAAESAGKDGQALVASLKGGLLGRDFEANVTQWMLGGEGQAEEDDGVVSILSKDFVPEVVESWVANVKGWGLVKW